MDTSYLTTHHYSPQTSHRLLDMPNLYKDLRLAIENGDTETTTKLLDNGLGIEDHHFRTATVNKYIDIVEQFLSRGWGIHTDMSNTAPSALGKYQIFIIPNREAYSIVLGIPLKMWDFPSGFSATARTQTKGAVFGTARHYPTRSGMVLLMPSSFFLKMEVKSKMGSFCITPRCEPKMTTTKQLIYNQDPDYNKLCVNKLLDEGTLEYSMSESSGLGTPLHYAARSGSAKMVTFLVEQGGAPDLQDPYRRTPISYAIRNGHHDIEQFLKSRMDADINLAQSI